MKKRVEDEFFYKELILEEAAVKEKLNEILANTDKQIAYENKCDYKLSGCSFTLLLNYNNVLYLANMGAVHCLYVSAKETKKGTSSRGNASSFAGSEIFKMSQASGGSAFSAKTTAFATTNPMKAVALLFRATNDLTTPIYGGKFSGFHLNDVRSTEMEIITNDHTVTNYEELLRVIPSGAEVCKDKKKHDLPYYARNFKLYINPLVPHPNLVQSSDWPALRVSRYHP